MIKAQIEKWTKLQTRREEEHKMKARILELEEQLSEATTNEDYDLATDLQGEIDKIHSMQSQGEEQPFELVEQSKLIQSEFITQIKDDRNKLIEIESKLSTEKNIYQKSESEKIEYAKEDLVAKNTKVDLNEKDVEKNIKANDEKLKVIEKKCYENCKEHIDEKSVLDKDIIQVNDEIEELERQLKLKTDKKRELEKQQKKKVKLIKKINEEFEGEIEDLNEIKEKYENKKVVNNETKVTLKNEKEKIEDQVKSFEIKLSNYDEQISGFLRLSNCLKSHLRREERSLNESDILIKEYEKKMQDFKELNEQFISTEQTIEDQKKSQGKVKS